MKKWLWLVLPYLLVSSGPVAASSLRCGTELISVGDRGFQILQKCGEPQYRETMGYKVGRHHRIEQHIEEWVYGPRNGMTYILRMEGNRLRRIDAFRQP